MCKKGQMTLACAVLLWSLLGADALIAQGLGKFSEWSEPINLGPVINSEFGEIGPAISPNGLSFYFTSDRPGGFGSWDVWVSQRAGLNAPWGEPQNLGPVINGDGDDRHPNFLPDGNWLYFASDRAGGCGGFDLYVSGRKDPADDFGWGPPVNLGCIINTDAQENSPAYFADAETGIISVYFHGIRPRQYPGQGDIYMSNLRRDGVFGSAALVWELSSPQPDQRPSIRRDGLEIFMLSRREGGLGRGDLWVSTRATTRDAWSAPVNLGPVVNTVADEAAPALSDDGTTLYFSSDRPGGYGDSDLYVSTRKRLPE